MDQETVRKSFNVFLKMYFDSCKEIYAELDNREFITGRQFEYLRMIDKHHEVTMGELADLFQLSKPTVTEMAKKFEETGLIVRRRCKKDARVTYISLTEKGQTLAKTNVLESQRAVEKIFNRLTETEVRQLTELFNKFKEADAT
ncbi:MAG: MarR family transcriptional regulator [Acholeplasmatales bacterium]|nr:MAG: MarR family transcriptional regulator [Acholeplasmatales bacterium]